MPTPAEFCVTVEEATFVPDEAAVREFIAQLRKALQDDPALRKRLDDKPREVLCERGVPLDLQNEMLVASGLAGGEDTGCGVISCVITDIGSICGGTIVIVVS